MECITVFTLGLSPPIATEFLLGLSERGVKVGRAIAVTTRGALPSFHALRIALHWSSRVAETSPRLTDELRISDLSHVELNLVQLTIEDIEKREDCKTFRSQFSKALRTAVKWAVEKGRVYVCVAGGRKTMPVDATLVSIAEAVENVYHVVAPEIPGIATEFANLVSGRIGSIRVNGRLVQRGELLEKLKRYADEPNTADGETVKYVLNLCFPPKDLEFHLIKMPTPHLTREERERFRGEVLG